MVSYGSLYRLRQPKAPSTPSRPSDTPSTMSSPDETHETSHWASSSTCKSLENDMPVTYVQFNDQQQHALLQEARANAAALLVDAVADADKWQFVTARGPLNVYELRADAMDRVSSMTPADPSQLAHHMHTMLATTRVRASLDDFMRLMASIKKDTFQNVQAALFEDRVELADLFTSFGDLSGSTKERSSSPSIAEQYAVKYVAIRGRPPRSNSSSSLSASAASNSLKFGGKNRHRDRQAARRRPHKGVHASESVDEVGLTMCLGEYATIRPAQLRGPMVHQSAQDVDDPRVGIISIHSIVDPAVTRYCQPIVTSVSPTAPLALTARALIQFSGIVVYPVACSNPDDKRLEVLIKLSCYDVHGVTSTRRMNMLSYLMAYQTLTTALVVVRLQESPYLTSTHWVKARKSCGLCTLKFSMARRKHHCRLCGDVVCSKCSSVHQIRLGKTGKNPFRICLKCDHRYDLEVPSTRTSHQSLHTLRRRLGSDLSKHPEEDDEGTVRPDRLADPADVRPLVVSERTPISTRAGSLSQGLGKSGSYKTLSISGSSLPGSFYLKPSTATTASSSQSDDELEAFDVASSSSSCPSSPSHATPSSPECFKRFSDLSFMDFHDSEFAFQELPLRYTELDFDDLDASPRPSVDSIGNEDALDIDDGMEFHDSNVGLDYQLDDVAFQEADVELEIDTHSSRRVDEERTIRLKAYAIFDSGNEFIYDLVVKQAAELCHCSFASLSFLDARREYIKASAGVVSQVTEVLRPNSVLARLMERLQAPRMESVVIFDATLDPELSTHVLVMEAPRLRFFMAVPCRARDGSVLGALIVADSTPRRTVTPFERTAVGQLADQVDALLEDRRLRHVEHVHEMAKSTDLLRDQLVDLLSQSYSTGLQMQQNERQMELSTTSCTLREDASVEL
ncbi:hypothetical protein CCR75_003649 [Bremia lactucae]|uniref:FYVE-type domain-containing protein n=1 Tax=Bremia lactucae TaxID=4779 RepID=A0A976IL35_BRELC|nr:hypothetical protein CCR75_003649 [Bremia lactucae]